MTSGQRGQRKMLLATPLLFVGGVLPWLYSPVGPISGLRGAGLWVFYVGMLALAGALLPPRFRPASLVQALIVAAVAIILPLWQVGRMVSLVGFAGWAPGPGLVMSFGGGVVCAVAARELWRHTPSTGADEV
ncbi:MAG: hypothetical protein WBA72_05050 [Ornithinimicrobium sp.]